LSDAQRVRVRSARAKAIDIVRATFCHRVFRKSQRARAQQHDIAERSTLNAERGDRRSPLRNAQRGDRRSPLRSRATSHAHVRAQFFALARAHTQRVFTLRQKLLDTNLRAD